MIAPVKNGYITSDYKAHAARGLSKSLGYDIGCLEKNTPIYSAFQGVIVSNGYSDTFGNRVWIKITEECKYKGLYNVYPHLKEISEDIEDGNVINAGRVIGLMGNTGKSFGDHLHFELRTKPDASGDSVECSEILEMIPYKK